MGGTLAEHRIFQMASFSRSGETLMQRCLGGHPKIEVVHQLHEPDTKGDLSLFRFLRNYDSTTISANHPRLAHRKLKPGTVLLLKNAVWTQNHPRNGFILIRNPFSIVASAFRDAPDADRAERQKDQQVRWAKTIDPLMMPAMSTDPTIVGFTALYARKMLHDIQSGLPFVRYEDFIQDPEKILRQIVAHMGLDWHDNTLKSHEAYKEGDIGHGGIKLWQAVHARSETKYKDLSAAAQSMTYSITHEALRAYGYHWDGKEVSVKNNVSGRL